MDNRPICERISYKSEREKTKKNIRIMALPSYKYGCPATTWKKIYVLTPFEGLSCSGEENEESYFSFEHEIWVRNIKPIRWFEIPSFDSTIRVKAIIEGEQFEALEKAREIALREEKLKRIHG